MFLLVKLSIVTQEWQLTINCQTHCKDVQKIRIMFLPIQISIVTSWWHLLSSSDPCKDVQKIRIMFLLIKSDNRSSFVTSWWHLLSLSGPCKDVQKICIMFLPINLSIVTPRVTITYQLSPLGDIYSLLLTLVRMFKRYEKPRKDGRDAWLWLLFVC